MKQTLKRLFLFPINAIARVCLVAWIFGVAVHHSMAAADDDRRPSEHFCPITYEVMKDPVVAADGYSYEREAIETYFKGYGNARSPMTSEPLPNKTLVNNQALKTMINDWTPNLPAVPSPTTEEAIEHAMVLEKILEESQMATAVAPIQAEDKLTLMAAIEANAQVMATLQAKLQALESRETKAIEVSSSSASGSGSFIPSVPFVARGYEAIYRRILNGVLIYRPNGDGNDNGRINLPIRELGNPLEGTFDLSRCGDTGNYLSISTGYRKGKKPENASKLEIWFAPRFLIEKELNGYAAHFTPIMGNWKQEAPVGMFWTWGGDVLADYDYLTTENMDNLSKINLYENWNKTVGVHTTDVEGGGRGCWLDHDLLLYALAHLQHGFHVHFVN